MIKFSLFLIDNRYFTIIDFFSITFNYLSHNNLKWTYCMKKDYEIGVVYIEFIYYDFPLSQKYEYFFLFSWDHK